VTTWLHRIVVNACLDRARRRQVRPAVPLETAQREPVAATESADTLTTRLVIRDALTRLPADQRAALVLVDLEGLPVAEVAAILGVAEGTVKSRCARGRARLAVLLGHLRDDDGNRPDPSRVPPASRRAEGGT
jgi:RNA polymerase sigma-70 factor (ECF subfamily)